MIPFFYPHPIVLVEGVLEIHVFGILVGIAVVLGSWLAQKRAEQAGLNPRVIADLALWVVVLGFIGAHLVSLFAYFPERVFGDVCSVAADCPNPEKAGDPAYICQANGRCNNGDWLEIFRIWSGISSFGGFLGAFVGVVTFFSLRRIVIIPKFLELEGGRGRPTLKYIDAVAFGFAFAWIFGRAGCFTAHDHIGMITDFPLSVCFPNDFRDVAPPGADPDGCTRRFDLGFLEMLWSIAMSAFFWFWARHRTFRPGWYAAVMMMCYAPYRFVLDGLRAVDIDGADRRYFADLIEPGITPGHIGAIVVFAGGLWVWWLGGRRKNDEKYLAWKDGTDVTLE
jgi:phosphatidylglycerol:prolipoprotein diacylglycerol transferase